jgi:hypothetical protein
MSSWELDFINELESAKFNERTNVKKRWAALMGKSVRQLDRIAKKYNAVQERKTRCDKGKCTLDEYQILYVASVIEETKRKKKGVITPVEAALEIAVDNGVIEEGCISVDRLQQILAERGLDRASLDAPNPHIEMQSLHPNHVHVVDVSVCIQWYLKGKKGMQERDEAMLYDNKIENYKKIKMQMLRYVLVDHCSGAFFVKYYYAPGENQENMFDFLMSAWAFKDEKFPFRGKPKFLLMDAGSANISKSMLNMLEKLDIQIPRSMPKNPRRQGAVETMHNVVEAHFESRLRIQPAESIEQLNKWALDWCVYHNAKKVMKRHKMTRTQAWLKITQEQLIEMPGKEVIQEFFAKPSDKRTVTGNLQIPFNGVNYSLRHIPNIASRDRVEVVMKPLIHPTIVVIHRDVEYLCEPMNKNNFGFSETAAVIGKEYKSQPETPIQQAKKVMEVIAHGSGEERQETPFHGAKVFGHQREKLADMPDFMPRKGTPFEVSEEDVKDKLVPIMTAIKEIVVEVGRLSPELNKQIREQYGKAISIEDKKVLIQSLKDGSYGKEETDADNSEALSG